MDCIFISKAVVIDFYPNSCFYFLLFRDNLSSLKNALFFSSVFFYGFLLFDKKKHSDDFRENHQNACTLQIHFS